MSTSAPSAPDAAAPLARRLGLGDAVVIGLAAMIGAGIFSALAPAAGAAGSLLLVALLVAAVVAYANASSSAQLAAQYPSAGGTYVYGRERLGEWWGFAAGWCFVIGKTASCAAMALAFAAYAVPPAWQRPVAALAVAALVAVNSFGITRTARLARVLVVAVLAVLVLVAVSAVPALVGGAASGGAEAAAGASVAVAPDAYGVLQGAGLLFFAFAGYARIATLGEEVRNPTRTIPRAIAVAFGIALVLYAVIAAVALGALGPVGLASSADPLVSVVRANGWDRAAPVVRVGAALACLGALLALVAGVGRTALAMAREGDLPRGLAAVHPLHRVPRRAELVLGAVVVLIVLTVDLRGAIGFSSFGVLLYYFVANAAAFTQAPDARRYPRALPVLGAVGCAVLVVTLPVPSVVAGAAVVAVGLLGRLVVRAVGRSRGRVG
ncbi:APC family permease [Herbiconiux flava]|uniref:APA family basic amino acid/polyamine antiporter n=1 Tax=Herbiconiux flava TaxID=881268 RepID=A0A852S8F0_9MICO|nr:APC family permease [Herbiconiux flava]NYD69538.1 APA family basic amino acid/polyamine antiporter [Herbiconiux flava]GLK16283.1 amino acid transporter [Herbiconiux flava]